MNEPEPVDLSPLHPQADAERWLRLTEATRLRVAAVLRDRVGTVRPSEARRLAYLAESSVPHGHAAPISTSTKSSGARSPATAR